MLPVPTSGSVNEDVAALSRHQVMRVYTVTVIDDAVRGHDRQGRGAARAAQYRTSVLYDRHARPVAGTLPPTINIRL